MKRTNPLTYLKALAALVGSLATALLAVYGESEVLVVTSIVATVVATWVAPYLPADADAPAALGAADAGHEEPLTEKPVDTDGYIGQHEATS